MKFLCFQPVHSQRYQLQFNFEFLDAWVHWDLILPYQIQDHWEASQDFGLYCMGQEL